MNGFSEVDKHITSYALEQVKGILEVTKRVTIKKTTFRVLKSKAKSQVSRIGQIFRRVKFCINMTFCV